jgi:hypothetical protein
MLLLVFPPQAAADPPVDASPTVAMAAPAVAAGADKAPELRDTAAAEVGYTVVGSSPQEIVVPELMAVLRACGVLKSDSWWQKQKNLAASADPTLQAAATSRMQREYDRGRILTDHYFDGGGPLPGTFLTDKVVKEAGSHGARADRSDSTGCSTRQPS